ncbi:FadR/GntR family transcriptional regulator [Pelomonas cellulosilytica]|uniref:FadR family transcriptional regulator n=1 Tax=Pelomonas cellulosilytica TaxID=2906762 RepID=A0ABS8XTX8_9BURK|nr:FadR/GntR family transcriptional regulator [Pelomonas sp. P8]MCE4555323.1 FadR family transcriptional regulator [Pelomonas sp. P8]
MLEPLKGTDSRRLYHQIADQLRELIREGRYRIGSRLPPERELAQQLGVSRPSVREALIALEIAGCVEVRMGAGIYVRSSGDPEAGTTALGESPLELMQARVVLEGGLMPQACTRVTPRGLAAVREALDAMREAMEAGRPALDADRRFHLAVAAMAGNAVLERMVGELFDGRYSPMSLQLSARADTHRNWRDALVEHERILAALEAHDPLAAQAAMRTHLLNAQQRWAGNRLAGPSTG